MKLEGSFDTFPLRELIDMVSYSSVTGALNIFGPGEQGQLYFRDGVLYHVVRGAARGVDALAELLELSQAQFTFVSDTALDEESLWGPLHHHLQSAERIATRWRQLRAYVPSLELVPLLTVARETALRRVGPAHHQILAAIDGQTTLRQIAASLGWAEIDVAEAAVQMTLDGLVDLRSQQAPTPSPCPEASPEDAQGVFDRIRSRAGIAPQRPPEVAPLRVPDPRSPEDLILKLLRG